MRSKPDPQKNADSRHGGSAETVKQKVVGQIDAGNIFAEESTPPPPPSSSSSSSSSSAAPAKPLRLRLRGSSGVKTIEGLTSASIGEALRRACDALLGGTGIQSLSFRGDDGANVVLITEGEWKGMGVLLMGPDRTLEEMSITTGTMFCASAGAASGKKRAPAVKGAAGQCIEEVRSLPREEPAQGAFRGIRRRSCSAA